ncbi:uncharacterized protein Z520_05858 [Fonsecaea multimorphosa CBS 102226]|uniref:Fe2OG dioxygenase domain-containing protein n=1 Tax=Fonsecaea multimorphosa CBS 102226 TaxID=1442371 RepID=A0A0D2JYE0_9EURO|nr:uncharacterized protein Z520_05858 [Fonsecaea multimorphosa CBS 102226]KIX98557.1 hypothetical protein Z520_05858 [Fonsecaea multimorphosa CBS 102226]OAL24748.1 hypothetical protein AYO22_05537 [Fonsecaea multimorphosa]
MAMAQVVVPPVVHTSKIRPIISNQLRHASTRPRTTFDPEKHLVYREDPKVLMLKDIGLSESVGISPVAISEPFPLFSEEAISHMRDESFTNEVWDNCLYSTDFAGCQLRGHCPKYAPFMYDAWKNPKTLSIVSKIAGIDLVPAIDIEVGNINVSVQDPLKGFQKQENQSDDDIPVTKWHVDSYPFVCVVMMSDASHMVGGETAIKTGAGEIIKVRGPQMGSGVVLQGRHITHQALGALGGSERITMVTAFRPRDALIPDSSVLTTIRPITNLSDLYFQWTEYRVEVLQERLRLMLEVLREQHRADEQTDAAKIKEFLQQQVDWLSITDREIVL